MKNNNTKKNCVDVLYSTKKSIGDILQGCRRNALEQQSTEGGKNTCSITQNIKCNCSIEDLRILELNLNDVSNSDSSGSVRRMPDGEPDTKCSLLRIFFALKFLLSALITI